MTNKPDGKPPAASDDARASDGKDADARREEAVAAADQRLDEHKRKADTPPDKQTASGSHDKEETASETDLVTDALDHGSDA